MSYNLRRMFHIFHMLHPRVIYVTQVRVASLTIAHAYMDAPRRKKHTQTCVSAYPPAACAQGNQLVGAVSELRLIAMDRGQLPLPPRADREASRSRERSIVK